MNSPCSRSGAALADTSTGEGYDLNHDGQGRWLGPANPTLVGQARVLWFFAHLRRHGRAVPADAARAERGYAILTERLWDRVHGGFFWEVAAKGYAPTCPTSSSTARPSRSTR